MQAARYIHLAVLLFCILYMASTPKAQVSMYADPKAHEEGDVITVVLAERTSAERATGWEKQSSANKGVFSGLESGSAFESRFSADARFSSDTRSHNESVQSDLLRGTFSAQVTGVSPNGNLVVQGERRLNINGETHLMKVSGLVRPYDVQYNNSVYSFQIANASIEYREAGTRSRWFAPGFWARVGTVTAAGVGVLIAVLR